MIKFAIADDHTADSRFVQETVDLNMSSKSRCRSASIQNFQPMQPAEFVAYDDEVGRNGGDRANRRVKFEAGGLGAGSYVP